MIVMKISPFPTCCGAYNIHDFGDTEVTTGRNTAIDYDIVRNTLIRYDMNYTSAAFKIIILNNQQMGYSDVLKECGYSPITTGYNENHLSILTMFVKIGKKK